MGLLAWKQFHETNDEDQTQETRKAGKQTTETAKHARRGAGQKEGRPWEAGKQDGREASKQKAGKQGSREAGKGKQGSTKQGGCAAERLASVATGKLGNSKVEKQRSREASRQGSREGGK